MTVSFIKSTFRPVKNALLIFGLLLPFMPQAQETTFRDTASIKTLGLPELFITATRTQKSADEIPARISSIKQASIDVQPVFSTDALLEMLPGVNVDRPQGIFSKNASITMRGLNGSPRLLVLVDGVYGGNAMAGVVNVITRQATTSLEGEAKAFYGSCNTYGGLLRLGGRVKPVGNSFYYGLYGFYRKGDGYIITPESSRDSMDVKTYLWELSAGVKAGYRYGSGSFTEVEYNYYSDKRGDGTKIYEPEGGYNRYPMNYLRLTSNNYFGRFNWIVRAFYQHETYMRQSETMSVKKGMKYTLYETESSRIDKGIWTNLTYKLRSNMELTAGLDLKQGSVDGKDTYLTSTDVLRNQGKMNFLALFAEYEWQPFNKKMTVMAGMRYDVARFFDGAFTIEDPTTLTEFMTQYPSSFMDVTWQAWSPKLGLKYRFNNIVDGYFSYSHGFRPAMLDDMCRNGNISKGFKLANPQLQPENADNLELGANLHPVPSLCIEPSIYCTIGTDFQYFVGNGDSISTGGDNLKPVLMRENVSQVRVLGGELACSWRFNKNFSVNASYAYNNSQITKFDTVGKAAKDLTGKYLMEVPFNQVFAGVYYSSRILQASLIFNARGAQWSDDENTTKTPGYNIFDLKVGKTFFNKLNVSVVIQDIFNTRYYDSKGDISPGRFFMLNLSYRFANLL